MIEALRRQIIRVAAGVRENNVRMKVEYLQARSVEGKPLQFKSSRAGHEVEIVSVIGRNFENLILRPEWPQTSYQRDTITRIVFEPETLINREQSRIIMKTVRAQPLCLRSKFKRARNDASVGFFVAQRCRVVLHRLHQFIRIAVTAKIRVQCSLMAWRFNSGMCYKERSPDLVLL